VWHGSGTADISHHETAPLYRLPTEAEWEYAALGGQGSRWSGSDAVEAVAWYDGNSGSRSHRVGTRQANGHGLFDMSGNVWEWAWDWKADYPTGNIVDPTGPTSGSLRVIRGGSWFNESRFARVSYRFSCFDPGYRSNYLGFRLARSVP
jgi:formylglycine-generating enzyme required for sulfatase activity